MTTEMAIVWQRHGKPQSHFQERTNQLRKEINRIESTAQELHREARQHGFQIDMQSGIVYPAKVIKQ